MVGLVLPAVRMWVAMAAVAAATVEEPRAVPQTGGRLAAHGKCEPITIPLCANIAYNMGANGPRAKIRSHKIR